MKFGQPMSVTIRSLHKSDADQVVALCLTAQPERVRDVKIYLRRFDEPEREAAEPLRQWVAVDDVSQQRIGYAACWKVIRRKYRMDLMVHPVWRGRRIGGALFETVLVASQDAQAATLQARTWDDWPESLEFLRRRDFFEIHRMIEMQLKLSEADWGPLAELPERLTAQGVQFGTLQQEAQDEQFWAKLTDLHQAVVDGWPDPDPDGDTTKPTEDEVRRLFTSLQVTPDALFVAKANGVFIGYTAVSQEDRVPGASGTGPTAVRPEYRGRGVATALKVLSLSYARRQGWQTAVTRSANPAMIRINEKLGFKRGRAEVRLVRKLAERECNGTVAHADPSKQYFCS